MKQCDKETNTSKFWPILLAVAFFDIVAGDRFQVRVDILLTNVLTSLVQTYLRKKKGHK